MAEKVFIPYKTDRSVPKGKMLVFAPHPDDEIFGCGGAIIRHVQNGDAVKVVIVTDGGFPVVESQKTPNYPEIRKKESFIAAKILGYGKPDYLDFKDGFLKADEKLIDRLHQIIVEFRPLNIYLPAETEIHPDHLELNKAAIEAVKRLPRNVNLFFYEIGQPLLPDFFLDISYLQPTLDRAMDCFKSQLAVQDYKTHIRSLHAYRSFTLGKDVKFAEAYRIMKSDELKTGEMLWQEKQKSEGEQLSELKTKEGFPLISVIVRTMNRPQLAEALDSIARQSYPNVEVIVVDAANYGRLNLGKTCGNFALRIINKNKKLNRPEAANAGLDVVKGAYFCFLDEDDLYLHDHILTMYHSTAGSKEIAAYCSIKKVDMSTGEESWLGSNFSFENLLRENYIPNLALLFRSDLIEKGCRFDADFEIYEDWDFLIQAAHHGKFRFVEIQGGIYRNFHSSEIHTNMDMVFEFRKKMFLKWIPLLSDEDFKLLIPGRMKEKFNLQLLNVVLTLEIEKVNTKNELLKSEVTLIKQNKGYRIATKLFGIYQYTIHKSPLHILKRKLTQVKNLTIIKESGLFDKSYYLQYNPDVKQAGINPLIHYLKFGGFEGRNPCQQFDSAFYLQQNTDVKEAGINPLLHYVNFGKSEGRQTNPTFFIPSQFDKAQFFKQKQTELDEFIRSSENIDLRYHNPQISVILVLFNKAELTLSCLKSIKKFADVPLEIIIVDNHSTDLTGDLLRQLKVSRVIRNPENRHFLEACNQGLEYVSAPNVLFLNNDTEIEEGALSSALNTLNESDDYGAVGAKLILHNGSLQEAGNIIWHDGSCTGYGRGDSPDRPEYNFKRIVDYCSGAFLLTRTSLIKQYGGFDTQFAPAYYEETDYCLWLQTTGLHVVYDPNVTVRHFEFGSGGMKEGIELQKINQRKFVHKYKVQLESHFLPDPSNILRARFAASQRYQQKILYIDDRIPHPDLGMGYPRSSAIVHGLQKSGCQLTFYPNTFPHEESLKECYRDFPQNIEIALYFGHNNFQDFLEKRSDYYDIIWVSRPHNMKFNMAALEKYRNRYKIIYDAEAIFAERILGQAQLNHTRLSNEKYLEMLNEEIMLCKKADKVVAVSQIDADKIKSYGLQHLHILGHTLKVQPGSLDFDHRKDLLFVGNMDNDDTPNVDSILWFANEVFPLIKIEIPGIALHIVGSNKANSIKAIVLDDIHQYGKVENLSDYYNRSRVFVAPTRFSAGVPYKIHEAAANGLPVVATRLLAGQLEWKSNEMLLASDADKTSFAEAVVRLYSNQSLWEMIRQNALDRIKEDFSVLAYEKTIVEILK